MTPSSDQSGPPEAPAPRRRVRPDYRPAPLRRTGAAHGRVFALLIVGLLLVGVGLTWSAARTGRTDPERLQLGDRIFTVGRAESLAKAVEKNGPLLFQDPLGAGRHVFVQYLGAGEWTAFQAVRAGRPERCVLRWDGPSRTLRDPCDATSVAADGGSLVHYETTVDAKGRLLVDLNTVVPNTVLPVTAPPVSAP